MTAYGPPAVCSRCGGEDLRVLDEAADPVDSGLWVGEVRCQACACEMVYARRPGVHILPPYFFSQEKTQGGGMMRLFELERVGTFCDSFRPRLQKKRDHEIRLVDVALRIHPLTAEAAGAIGVKRALFTATQATPIPDLKGVEFSFEVPRQQIHVFAAPDIDQPSFVFDQVDIAKVRAKMAKGGWGLVFHATFGPVSKQELEGLNAWFGTQRFLTFKEASPSLEFGEAEGTDADQKARRPRKPGHEVIRWEPEREEKPAEVAARVAADAPFDPAVGLKHRQGRGPRRRAGDEKPRKKKAAAPEVH